MTETEIPEDVAKAAIEYAIRYGGRCRECADADGICPTMGTPCDVDVFRSTVAHALKAWAYGITHGFIQSPFPAERRRHTVEAQPVPEGWQLVPIEPTETMLDGYWHQCGESKEMRARVHHDARRKYATLLSAAPAPPSRAEVTGEWQPIDTAPRDGTSILINDEYGPRIVWWGAARYNRKAKAYDFGWTTGTNYGYSPTHWMPLPAGPALGAGKKEGGE